MLQSFFIGTPAIRRSLFKAQIDEVELEVEEPRFGLVRARNKRQDTIDL